MYTPIDIQVGIVTMGRGRQVRELIIGHLYTVDLFLLRSYDKNVLWDRIFFYCGPFERV